MPLSVTTVSATNVGAQSVDLTGDVTDLDGNAEVDARFQYRQTGDSVWTNTEPQARTTTGQYTETVTGLLPSTNYEFRAAVKAPDDVLEVDHFERGTVTDGTYNGETGQFAVVEDSTTATTAMQGTKVLEMANMTDADRIWSVPANGLPNYPETGNLFRFEITNSTGGGITRVHFNLENTSNYNDLRIRWAQNEVNLFTVGGGSGDHGTVPFQFNDNETLTVEILSQANSIDVTIYREDGSVTAELSANENPHDAFSGFAWRTWFQGTQTTWIGGAETVIDGTEEFGTTDPFTTASSAGTQTETWSTQSDWDAAQDRDHLVSRNIGDRNADTLQQGYDTNYAPFNSDLVLYLTFDESGSPVVDYSPNNNDATLNGTATFNEEGLISSSGARVDGDGSYFEAADSASFNTLTDEITVVATYKPPASGFSELWAGLVGKGDTTWQMRRRDGDDRVTFNVRDANGNDIINGDSNSGLSSYDAGAYWTNGEWNQSVGSYSSINGIGKFYHNGTLYNTDAATATMGTNTQPVQFGINLAGSTYRRPWAGGLEEMMVFNKQLTDTEVQEIWDTLFNGYFLSDTRVSSYRAIELDVTSTLPANTSLDITVHQDTTGDGTSDNTQTVSLTGGTETISLSGFSGAQGAEYWFEANFASTDKTETAQLDSVSLVLEEDTATLETASHAATTQSLADSSASSSETADGLTTVTGTASASGAGSDSSTHSMTMLESADETGSSSDSGSNASTMSYNTGETGSSSDSGSHAATLSYNAGETGAATETVGQTLLLVKDVNSTATSAATATAQHTVNISPSTAETGSSTDTASQSLFLLKTVDSTGLSEDTATAQHTINVVPNTTETAASSEDADHSILFTTNIQDTGISADAVEASLSIDVAPTAVDIAQASELVSSGISYTGASTTLSSAFEQATVDVTTITEVVTEAVAEENASVTVMVVEEADGLSTIVETAALTLSLDSGAESVIDRIQHVFHVLGKYDNVHNVKGVYLIVRSADGEYKNVFDVKGVIND